MRGIKQFGVLQTAYCTTAVISMDNQLPKGILVEPLSCLDGQVAADIERRSFNIVEMTTRLKHRISGIDRGCHPQSFRVILDNNDGPDSLISSGTDSVEIDKGDSCAHGISQSPVIGMIGFRSPVRVPEQSIGTEAVIIRSAGDRRYR